MAFTTRVCSIKKCAGFKGFGFTLHAEVENGICKEFINKIDEGSPAESSGLLVGDRLVEVNGVNIEKDSHQQVIEKILACGDEVRLLVVDRETDIYYTGLGVTVTAPKSRMHRPRPNSPVTPVSGHYSSRRTHAPGPGPGLNTSSETTRLIPASNRGYMTNRVNTGSQPPGYRPTSLQYGTLPPTTNDCAAWFACLCCFWPAALVALVKNSDARDCIARGDMVGANAAAESARRWTSISICVGVVILVILGACIGVLRVLRPDN